VDYLVLFAKKAQASPEERLFGLIFIGIIVVVCPIY
jgi:hypothetical protein